MSEIPILSSQERKENAKKAIAARKERALYRGKISKGEISPLDLLNIDSQSIKRMRITDLLSAVPGIGKRRTFLILEKAKIASNRRVGGLGKHQIEILREELLLNKQRAKPGSLIVMSGPGGVGKSTISKELGKNSNFWISISATTRAPREGEVEGKDYYFISDAMFDEMISKHQFLEWAEFAGNRYGTPKDAVIEKLDKGVNVLLEIEIAGARQIKSSDFEALFIFIAPPNWEELEMRLSNRGTDSPERRAARLALAREEMDAAGEFDHIIVNSEVNEVTKALVSLVSAKSEVN